MTKHPSEAVLALIAGGDLGSLRRWRVERHVATCEECGQEVSEFSELRAAVPAMMEPPEISWTKLAAPAPLTTRWSKVSESVMTSAGSFLSPFASSS